VTAPIGQGTLAEPAASAAGDNPVCGDRLRFQVELDQGRIALLRFQATACPACIAVASCAVEALQGATIPAGPPYPGLRALVAQRGGLSRFEQHALALVEEVLGRLLTVARD
jgi:nitrogen fixation NifU-like protein